MKFLFSLDTFSYPLFFFFSSPNNTPPLLCKQRAQKIRRGSRHNEIRSHIDKYQRTGATGFFCTHRYFENTAPLVIHGHTQTDSVVTTKKRSVLKKKAICKLAEKDRMQMSEPRSISREERQTRYREHRRETHDTQVASK